MLKWFGIEIDVFYVRCTANLKEEKRTDAVERKRNGQKSGVELSSRQEICSQNLQKTNEIGNRIPKCYQDFTPHLP